MKKLFAGLLFLLLPFCLSAQPSAQSSLSSLEDFVVNFENESLTQKILIEDLQKQLGTAKQSVESLESQLTEISELQERQSNLLKKYEFKCKVYKIVLTVTIPVTIMSIGTTILAWNVNNK